MEAIRFQLAYGGYKCDAAGNQSGDYFHVGEVEAELSVLREQLAQAHNELAEAKRIADDAVIELSKEIDNSSIWFDRATTQKLRADETAHKLRLAQAALRMYQRYNGTHADLDSAQYTVGELGLGVYGDEADHAKWAVNYLDGWKSEDKQLFLAEIEKPQKGGQ